MAAKTRCWTMSHLLFFLLFCLPFFLCRSEMKRKVNEGLKKEHQSLKNKAEEERHLKEERNRMAIEAFENWLVSPSSHLFLRLIFYKFKSYSPFLLVFYLCIFYIFHQTRKCLERETTKRNANPPWSPPSKTISYRK